MGSQRRGTYNDRTVGEAATGLIRRRSQIIRVGYDQGVAMQEVGGPGRGCGDIFLRRCHNNPTAVDVPPW